MSKPTIVCVPGAWHSPDIYARVLDILNEYGYPTIGLPLPSVGAVPPNMSFDEDVNGIRNCLTKLVVEEEKDVVLVMHSYTGMPGAEAPAGLGKKERQAANLKGGVIRLVFIMAFAMPEGFQPTAGGVQFPEWMKADMEVSECLDLGWQLSNTAQNGIVTVPLEDAKKIFYNDISPEEGDAWASKLAHQSIGVYTSTTSYAAWRHIPSTYVIGTEDKTTFTPGLVDFIINSARSIEPSAFDVVEKCDGGHCLMISRPEWLADVLRRAAGESF
jgi:pimeloyl-ACP methyl ester carboxylesterase